MLRVVPLKPDGEEHPLESGVICPFGDGLIRKLASYIIVGGFIGMVISMALEAFKAFIRKRKKNLEIVQAAGNPLVAIGVEPSC